MLRLIAPFLACCLMLLCATPALAVLPPTFSTQWGGCGSGTGQFANSGGVAVDGAGNVYVSDTGNNRIQKFDPNGTFLLAWGTPGTGNGQFNGPRGVAVSGNRVFVVDAGNFRIQVFNLSGAYVGQWGSNGTGNGQFIAPRGIASDPSGIVYVTDAVLNRVQQFSSSGAYFGQFGTTGTGPVQFNGPLGIAVYGSTDLYIADTGNNRIQLVDGGGTFYGQWGALGAGAGQFNQPVDVAASGGHVYVADLNNNRMQMFNPAGGYLAQWGTPGGGPNQFSGPRGVGTMFGSVYVADGGASCRIQKFVPAPPDTCSDCVSPPDTCCALVPQVGGPWTKVLVGTRQGYTGWPYSVTLFDLSSPPPSPLEDNNWAAITRYNGPGNIWREDSLGTVFGLTLDEFGNIFVTHTSGYDADVIGNIFGASAGAIYRIDALTGAMNVFAVLPNLMDLAVDANFPGESMPGLGNITYDCRHHQFFVTNLEDGMIYRIQAVGVNGPTGNVVQTFDPLAPDNGLPGWAPIGQRLWGIQWHGDRLYYSVWRQDLWASAGMNEIRSVAILPSGAINPPSDQHEFFLPPYFASGTGGSGGPNNTNSMPVADISFSATGRMLCGERGIQQETLTYPHRARALEYVCSGGCWVPGNVYMIGDYGFKTNSGGGVDYDRDPFSGGVLGRAWVSGDALHLGGLYTDAVYGFQGLRPNVNGTTLNSVLVDADGNVTNTDKTFVGDVEAPGCPDGEVGFGSICGKKYRDANYNGVRELTEIGLLGWTIQLSGPGGPYFATTNVAGDYCFNNLLPGSYNVSEVGQTGWVQTAPTGGIHLVTLGPAQVVTGRDFGNYMRATGPPCAPAPSGLAAWWTFDDPSTATAAADVFHMDPPRNAAQLHGGASMSGAGIVGRALCVATAADYAVVPYADQTGIDIGAGPFSIEAWVRPSPGSGVRVIAEKRMLVSATPYRTRGWALYLDGLQAVLEIGDGHTTQVVTGPVLAADEWTHLAVSVMRSPAAGVWYQNGSELAVLGFTPGVGSVAIAADLYIGQASPAFGAAPGFQGCIDELDLHVEPLSAAKVAQIGIVPGIGKCPEYCRVPSTISICKDRATVQVCFTVCNNTATSQSYTWSLAGLPAGAGCSVQGPVTFSPPAGSVIVGPGACSPPICVTVPRPSGLTAQNATACYSVTIVNNATGATYTCTGKIRADNTCWCVTPPIGVVGVAGRIVQGQVGTPIAIPVGPCDPPTFPYRLTPVHVGLDGFDPQQVSLNGLPPGEPVLGTFTYDPAGTNTIEFGAAYARHDPAAPYEILLEADLDGDGNMEPVSATLIASTYDPSQTVNVPAPRPGPALELRATPNPFFGGAQVAFTLAVRGPVDLAVFDLSGRRVRTLSSGVLAAGAHRIEWDGHDDHGRKASVGVYFVSLGTGHTEVRTRLVKLQ